MLPHGTLTWKVVYTAHGSEHNVRGPDADVAEGQTNARWVVSGHARLFGYVDAGELDRAGNENDKFPATADSAPDPMQQAASKCGDDQACQMAAIGKLAHDPKAVAAMEARSEAIDAFSTRLDAWASNDPSGGTSCHITIDGTRTSDWKGGARFPHDRGIVTIPYSVHEVVTGSHSMDCGSDQSPDIALRADPITGVYNVLLPNLQVSASHETNFTTSGTTPNASDRKSLNINLPRVIVKGVPFPTTLQTLHGEQTVHHVGEVPAVARNVHLHGDTNATRDMYAVAKDRAPIALDAKVTWTFTPDHG